EGAAVTVGRVVVADDQDSFVAVGEEFRGGPRVLRGGRRNLEEGTRSRKIIDRECRGDHPDRLLRCGRSGKPFDGVERRLETERYPGDRDDIVGRPARLYLADHEFPGGEIAARVRQE